MIIYISKFTQFGGSYPEFEEDGGTFLAIPGLNIEAICAALELNIDDVENKNIQPIEGSNNLFQIDFDDQMVYFIKLEYEFFPVDYQYIVEKVFWLPYKSDEEPVEEPYMTVAEMIRALQDMPQDAKVIFTGSIDHHRGTTQCGDFGAPSITLEDYHTYEDGEKEEEIKIEGPLVKIALFGDATYRD
jgi:hypothetical protein